MSDARPHQSSLCCGGASVYNVTQPEMAARLGARKTGRRAVTVWSNRRDWSALDPNVLTSKRRMYR